MIRITLSFLIFFTFTISLSAQESPKDKGYNTLTINSIEGPLEFLASDWMTGRETGTKGEFMASDYIAGIFKAMGLKPGGNTSSRNPSYFQNINFIQTKPGDQQECWIIKKDADREYRMNLAYKVDYSITPGSQSVTTEAQVVFVGYGIDDAKLKQHDFKGLDVKGKILIRMSGYPGWLDPESKNYKRFFTADPIEMRQLEINRDLVAMAKGAVAIIEIRAGKAGFTQTPSNLPYRYNTSIYEGDVPFNTEVNYRTALQGPGQTSIARISLSERAFNELTEGCGIDFKEYDRLAANENITPGIMPIGVFMKLISTVDSRIVRGRNVIGVLEGEDLNSSIVIGAHYDHVGQIKGFIYNGSDDNASGTVGVMSIAQAMIATGVKPKVTIVFCAWTAEEKGLLGSAHYANNPLIKDIKCYMNYDMISRTALDDSTGMKCDFNYSSGLPYLKEITVAHINEYSLRLDMDYKTSERPSGGSDFSSFSRKGIPIFLVHGKFTPDYHQFTDHSDKAVLPYMLDIIRLGYLNIFELAHKKW